MGWSLFKLTIERLTIVNCGSKLERKISHKHLLYCGHLLCSRAQRFHLVSTKRFKLSFFTHNWERFVADDVFKISSLMNRLTSLSSSWMRVTFPVLGSTLKYSLEPFSKVRPYRTGSISGSVPLRMYICVPMLENEKERGKKSQIVTGR